jgi:nucleoside-diphosphate-sugar epimerase
MKKAFITGTDGFIGKRLKESLKNYHIDEMNEDVFEDYDWTDAIRFRLRNFKPDVVFHVGACSNTLETDVNYMMTRNFESTKIIVDYCSENNIPLIYSSSAANYGI